jgi:hypothetical protein
LQEEDLYSATGSLKLQRGSRDSTAGSSRLRRPTPVVENHDGIPDDPGGLTREVLDEVGAMNDLFDLRPAWGQYNTVHTALKSFDEGFDIRSSVQMPDGGADNMDTLDVEFPA